MRILVDTGFFSASISRRRRARFEPQLGLMAGHQVPVTDTLLTTTAELRHACRQVGHGLHEPVHANDLWIAASALHIGAPLLTADAIVDDVPRLNLHR